MCYCDTYNRSCHARQYGIMVCMSSQGRYKSKVTYNWTNIAIRYTCTVAGRGKKSLLLICDPGSHMKSLLLICDPGSEFRVGRRERRTCAKTINGMSKKMKERKKRVSSIVCIAPKRSRRTIGIIATYVFSSVSRVLLWLSLILLYLESSVTSFCLFWFLHRVWYIFWGPWYFFVADFFFRCVFFLFLRCFYISNYMYIRVRVRRACCIQYDEMANKRCRETAP